jgi:hypothetical protein
MRWSGKCPLQRSDFQHLTCSKLQVRVTSGQHGRKARRFFLTAAALTRLFEMPVIAHDFQRAFAVYFLFQTA